MRKKWPKNGTLRQMKTFLLLPLTINGETRWAERATWVESCTYYGPRGEASVTHYKWVPVAWGTVEEYVAKRDEWMSGTFHCG